ncbi:hypothetical protein HZA87_06410 [Candidatus Uhrbacteria bacterium]|nr:hypothetical protein [Candidatus Uhrbacteria bacterium]
MENQTVTTNDIMEFLQDNMVVKEKFNGLRDQVQRLEVKVNQVKLDLIDAMDEKMAALRGDLVMLLRGEDKKLTSLALPPFPQLSL